MLVKDIILNACDFTENYELYDALSDENATLTDEQEGLLSQFVKCFNLVRGEISSEYFPIVKFKRLTGEGGKINYSSIDGNLIDIITVKDVVGDNLKFKKFDGYIEVNASIVDICYTVKPEILTLDSNFTSLLPERVIAYGVVREYYFMSSLYDDAETWDNRFKNSIMNFQRKKSETLLPRRRWF